MELLLSSPTLDMSQKVSTRTGGQDKAPLRQGFTRDGITARDSHFDPLAINRRLGLFSHR